MRHKYNDYNSKNHVFIIGFIVIAIASVIVCILSKNALANLEKNHSETNQTVEVTTVHGTDDNSITVTDAQENSQQNENPSVAAYSKMCRQLTDMNVILDKDVNKTYKIDLSNLAGQNDIINSFTFCFYSEDGASDMGNVKGGFGISVDPSCPAMTDDSWYQTSDDFSVDAQGTYCEVTWKVPDEIKKYINIDTGKVLFGYWWSDVSSIRLDKVICQKYCIKNIPSDGSNKIDVGQTLSYSDTSPQIITVPISSLVEDNQTPQFISIRSSTNQPTEKYTGQISISTNSLYDKKYTEDNIVIFCEGTYTNIDWFIPDEIKKDIDHNGNIEITFNSCDNQDITIKSILTQYTTDK